MIFSINQFTQNTNPTIINKMRADTDKILPEATFSVNEISVLLYSVGLIMSG